MSLHMKILRNPKTEKYLELKKFVLSPEIPLYINTDVVHNGIDTHLRPNWAYTHAIMDRPEIDHWTTSGTLRAKEFVDIVSEILNFNGYEDYFFLRMALNSTHPQPEKTRRNGTFHCDHPYKHHNLLIYFTDTDAGTFVEEELYLPKEDDCITFEGAHAQQYPTYGRRVVLVATYMSLSNEGYMDKVEELNNRKEFKA